MTTVYILPDPKQWRKLRNGEDKFIQIIILSLLWD